MTSSRWGLGLTLAFLGFASILPAAAGAQPPVYLTQWGSLGSGDGQFQSPFGVATDAAGNVYVADDLNNRIQKFTSTGTYVTQWGSFGFAPRQFNSPTGVATDAAGNVYVADANSWVQKFTGTGIFLALLGSRGSGNGQFQYPFGVATDAAGNIYVADAGNFRIQKFTSTRTYLTKWGSSGSGDGQFASPTFVATDAAGNVYVVDRDNNRIEKFTSTGTYLTQWGSYGSGDGQFDSPGGVATDAAGNVYVADYRNDRIQKFTGTGAYLTQWGSQGSGNGQLWGPVGVATDAAGDVYVAEALNNRIQKFGPAPLALTFALTPNTLNLAPQGRWVTGFLEPVSPFAASDIDISSIRLNGTVPVDPAAPTALGDHDGNGVPDLMVKFDRAAVELTVSGGDDVPVTVTGTVDGHSFSGTDHIRVIRAVVSATLAASRLTAGADARETSSSEAMVGVGEHGPDQFALRAVMPNPAQQNLRVSFGLPDAQAARIEVFNVSGRLVAAREVASLGPGFHTITLGERATLPSGVYIVRLTQGGKRLTTRAVLVR